MKPATVTSLRLGSGLALLASSGWISAQTLVAVDDFYEVEAGRTLMVEAPGMLGNDQLDGEDLPPTAVAELLSPVLHGTLECPGNPSPDLCRDGSFEYTADAEFLGDDSFSYRKRPCTKYRVGGLGESLTSASCQDLRDSLWPSLA